MDYKFILARAANGIIDRKRLILGDMVPASGHLVRASSMEATLCRGVAPVHKVELSSLEPPMVPFRPEIQEYGG